MSEGHSSNSILGTASQSTVYNPHGCNKGLIGTVLAFVNYTEVQQGDTMTKVPKLELYYGVSQDTATASPDSIVTQDSAVASGITEAWKMALGRARDAAESMTFFDIPNWERNNGRLTTVEDLLTAAERSVEGSNTLHYDKLPCAFVGRADSAVGDDAFASTIAALESKGVQFYNPLGYSSEVGETPVGGGHKVAVALSTSEETSHEDKANRPRLPALKIVSSLFVPSRNNSVRDADDIRSSWVVSAISSDGASMAFP